MLKITKAKPNPIGKDRTRVLPPTQTQLAGEWIDITNTSTQNINMTGLEIWHLAYASSLSAARWDLLCFFNTFTLPTGQTVRLHSGTGVGVVQTGTDFIGANYHLYTNKGYAWNNTRSDQPTIFSPAQKVNIDQAIYNAPVPNGKILVRRGPLLV